MTSLKTSGVTALTAAIALSLGAIPLAVMAPSLLAGGPSLTIAPAAPAGTLTLATTPSQGTVTWNGKSQAFTGGQQCKITPIPNPAVLPSLLDITGMVGSVAGSAGFRDGSIGVFEFAPDGTSPANASQCFRVDSESFSSIPNETLKLALGAGASDTFGPLIATSVTVGLQAKSQDGTVEATMLRADGSTQALTPTSWKLKPGAAIPITLPTGKYKGISLKATGGSFSLVGATFVLGPNADAILDCTHPSITKGSTTATYIGAAGQPCAGSVAVTLTSGANSAELLKPNEQVPNAEFVFDLVWIDQANVSYPQAPLLPRTSADFDGAGGNAPTPLSWCPHLVNKTVNGVTYPVVADVNAASPPAGVVDQAPNYPGPGAADTRQFACIVSQENKVGWNAAQSINQVTAKERIYVYGDIKLGR